MNTLLEIFLKYPSVTIDSRSITKDQIFFAIKGESYDGNKFVLQALEAGAAYCVSSDHAFSGHEKIIVVEDTLISLQQLAHDYRLRFKIPFLAVTGSNGKTTTKELLAQTIGTKYKVHMTKGNYNNHLGVPLTLLSMPPDAEFAIIEMGANHVGEIHQLCEIAAPDYGIVTNIGIAHLEGFGGKEGVKKAKIELYRYLNSNGGICFLNSLEGSTAFVKDILNHNFVSILDIDMNLNKVEVPDSAYLIFSVDEDIYETSIVGEYNYNNIVVALGIGLYFGCGIHEMAKAVTAYLPSNNRSQLLQYKGTDLILDAYNANPSSVINAIDNLSKLQNKKRSLILGDMLELGDSSTEMHKSILDHLKELACWQDVVLIGPIFYSLKDAYNFFRFHQNTEDAAASIQWQDLAGQTILIKGSRGLKLESLIG